MTLQIRKLTWAHYHHPICRPLQILPVFPLMFLNVKSSESQLNLSYFLQSETNIVSLTWNDFDSCEYYCYFVQCLYLGLTGVSLWFDSGYASSLSLSHQVHVVSGLNFLLVPLLILVTLITWLRWYPKYLFLFNLPFFPLELMLLCGGICMNILFFIRL